VRGVYLLVKGWYLLAKAKLGMYLLKKYNPPMPTILKWPHPALRTRAVDLIAGHDYTEDREIIDLLKQMDMALRSVTHGHKLGLAANQIGSDKNIAIVLGRVCINPSFVAPKDGTPKKIVVEGCYSSDGEYQLERWPYVWCTWYDLTGKQHTEKSNGVFGHVFMHEVDHLNGVCIADIGTKQPEPKTT
jgi:peptide deformylase